MIMGVWTWSLLQFTVVLTAARDYPDLEEDINELVVVSDGKHRNAGLKSKEKKPEKLKSAESSLAANNESNLASSESSPKFRNGRSETVVQFQEPVKENSTTPTGHNKEKGKENFTNDAADRDHKTTSNQKKSLDESAADEESHQGKIARQGKEAKKGTLNVSSNNSHALETQQGPKNTLAVSSTKPNNGCLDFFIFYNEIWAIMLSILFQDGPFFIVRMIILIYYRLITHMNLFFTGKNIFVICLLLNRIRVIALREYKPWKDHMAKFKQQEANRGRKQQQTPTQILQSTVSRWSSHFRRRSVWRSMVR